MTTESSPFAGNATAITALRNGILLGRLPHAYVFSGPPQIGKGTLARWLAATLLCQNRRATPPDPCGICRACRRIVQGTHPDVQTFGLARQAMSNDRVSASRELGIDTVRELVREIDLLPYEAERKVYIIEDADALTDEAANGLLKTLEEPPAYATIVLIAGEDRRLPETIRSRCAILRLHPVPQADIAELLRVRSALAPEVVHRIAQLSAGRPGWALGAATDAGVLVEHDAHVDALIAALAGGATGRLRLAEKLAQRWSAGHRREIYATLYDWLGFWRSVMLEAATTTPAGMYPQHQASMDRLGANGVDAPAHAAARTLEAISHLDANVSTRMAIETLLLDLP
ncbi:MAG: DNA polymerase III subunit [Chloroflexota bacterium]|nr:DNA polymerase III subunit [Chloroflexota bacterium]